MALTDFVWARYVQKVTDGSGLLAGFYAAAIVAGGSATTIMYVEDNRMVLPLAAGALVGTWIAVRFRR
jgi:hypothetical protein